MITEGPSILLIEDDAVLRKSMHKGLSEQGYRVRVAGDLAAARESIRREACNLVLLDRGLPDGEGLDFIRELRESFPGIPVLVMTARGGLEDRIEGLDLGADDYIVKPFDFQEVSARVRALLRRSTGRDAASSITVSDLEIDLILRTVRRRDAIIECTPREFDVLVYLARTPGQPVSREMLMREVWKVQSRMTSMDNVIDVMMSRLREKVDTGHPHRLIHTVRGIGFMIREPS